MGAAAAVALQYEEATQALWRIEAW